MKIARLVGLFAIAFSCISPISPARAFDYKEWVQFLPSELGGLKKIGKHEGMNMEMNNEKWATLSQNYGKEGSGKEISLTIVCGSTAPQIQQFNAIPKIKMETEDQIMISLTVAGKEGFLIFDKAEKSGYLMIPLGDKMLITIEAEEIEDKDTLSSLAREIPLDKFKCSDK